MFKSVFISILSVFLVSPAFAQALKVSYVPKSSLQKPSSFHNPDFSSVKPDQINGLSSVNKGIHYTALFCRMENKVHKQLKIWVKLRAGNDDDYRKLCGQR
jgi:hypothetical protein